MRSLLAIALLSVSVFAQDDQSAGHTDVHGVGAKTTYADPTPGVSPGSDDEAEPSMAPVKTSPGTSASQDPAVQKLVNTAKAAADAAGAAAGGGVTCGLAGGSHPGMAQCLVTAKSPYHFEVSKDLAGMSQHMGAHGGMSFNGSNGYAVGIYGPGAANVLDAPPFPNQGCSTAAWFSLKPGGAPLGGATWDQAGAAGCASYGDPIVLRLGKYGCAAPEGTLLYFNVVTNMPPVVEGEAPWWGNVPDWNGVRGWRRKICDSIIGSPMGAITPAQKATVAANAAANAAKGAGAAPAAPVKPACNVCGYADKSTGSCISCEGDPVNCKICPAGTPGPGSK